MDIVDARKRPPPVRLCRANAVQRENVDIGAEQVCGAYSAAAPSH